MFLYAWLILVVGIVRGEKYSLKSDLYATKTRLLEFGSQPKSARDAWLEDHLKELSRRHEVYMRLDCSEIYSTHDFMQLAEQLYAFLETTRTQELHDSICGWLERYFVSSSLYYQAEI